MYTCEPQIQKEPWHRTAFHIEGPSARILRLVQDKIHSRGRDKILCNQTGDIQYISRTKLKHRNAKNSQNYRRKSNIMTGYNAKKWNAKSDFS